MDTISPRMVPILNRVSDIVGGLPTCIIERIYLWTMRHDGNAAIWCLGADCEEFLIDREA